MYNNCKGRFLNLLKVLVFKMYLNTIKAFSFLVYMLLCSSGLLSMAILTCEHRRVRVAIVYLNLFLAARGW